MLTSLKIKGFKTFINKQVELSDLKKINLLVGVNGSGKTSILEALAISSRLGRPDLRDKIPPGDLDFNDINSMIAKGVEISLGFKKGTVTYKTTIGTRGAGWPIKKEGELKNELFPCMIWDNPPLAGSNSPNRDNPFSSIPTFTKGKEEAIDLIEAQKWFKGVNPGQRTFSKKILRGDQFYIEDEEEISLKRLSGGIKYLSIFENAARIFQQQPEDKLGLLLVDDLGDPLNPRLRKSLVPYLLNILEKIQNIEVQIFATTHNVEVVKSAIENPETCSVYALSYDASLIDFEEGKERKVKSSYGINSSSAIGLLANMLGIDDLDLGYPELVVLVEEETKKTFLEALLNNKKLRDHLKTFEVQVPFQQGDGNIGKAIQNLLDLSKYFFFSDIWSNRYVVFTDYNDTLYDENGNAKESNSKTLKAIKAAQKNLGNNYILTRNGKTLVKSIEETYPESSWDNFVKKEKLDEETVEAWLSSTDNEGESKSKLAKFIGENISEEELRTSYPDLERILLKE